MVVGGGYSFLLLLPWLCLFWISVGGLSLPLPLLLLLLVVALFFVTVKACQKFVIVPNDHLIDLTYKCLTSYEPSSAAAGSGSSSSCTAVTAGALPGILGLCEAKAIAERRGRWAKKDRQETVVS